MTVSDSIEGYDHHHHGSFHSTAPSTSKARHLIEGVIDFAAGTAGGIAVVYTGQPLDTVKVKMQTFPGIYRNGVQCFLRTFKLEGVRRGLYAGTMPALAANVAENAVLFAAYGACQKVVASIVGRKSQHDLNPIHNAFAGSMAAMFSSLALCPTELIKCKLQALREMSATTGAAFSGGEPPV